MPEAALYRQLTHYYRLLDVSSALAKIPAANDAREAAETKLEPVRTVFAAGTLQRTDWPENAGHPPGMYLWMNRSCILTGQRLDETMFCCQ